MIYGDNGEEAMSPPRISKRRAYDLKIFLSFCSFFAITSMMPLT